MHQFITPNSYGDGILTAILVMLMITGTVAASVGVVSAICRSKPGQYLLCALIFLIGAGMTGYGNGELVSGPEDSKSEAQGQGWEIIYRNAHPPRPSDKHLGCTLIYIGIGLMLVSIAGIIYIDPPSRPERPSP